MIDRGSSGGPLVDLEGRVIGINSRGQGRGIGFTIPIDTAREVMAQLERGGIERGYLGITLQPLDRELADYFGVPDATGVVVNSVVAGLAGGGRRPRSRGDIITRFDGVAGRGREGGGPRQPSSAWSRACRPGEAARARAAARRQARASVDDRGSARSRKLEPAEAESELGFHVQEITDEPRARAPPRLEPRRLRRRSSRAARRRARRACGSAT